MCQLAGWSCYVLIYSVFYFAVIPNPDKYFFPTLCLDALTGILLTHMMRMFITKTGMVNFELTRQIISMVLTTVVFSFIYALFIIWALQILGWQSEKLQAKSYLNKVFTNYFGYLLFLLIWNFIYFTYHYIDKSRKIKLDTIRLESLVKELELKTIKSHINPHFIFNALNSIRALVDENPGRARTAITELSNILRSSMQAEKLETAPLERELSIVKDYLELEQIRFEDRLMVEYDIDEDTLDQQVPPMMLQTLVENAIKHGISKQINGGKVRIISDFTHNHHELVVQNTGILEDKGSGGGFGIASTTNRLDILYGDRADFSIKNIGNNMVEAKVIMPLTQF